MRRLRVGLIVAALSTAVYAWVTSRQRRQVLMRIEGSGAEVSMAPPLLAPPEKSIVASR